MRFLLFLFLLSGACCYGQTPPKIFRSYLAKHGFTSNEWLTLGSDGIFFYSSDCECGSERFAKGTWKIKGEKLYLLGFDSARSFPPAKVDSVKGEVTGKVLISATNHYGLPLKGLTLALFRKGNDAGEETYHFTDSNGKLSVDRNAYTGFHLLYEWHPSVTKDDDTLKYHFFWPTSTQYNVRIDFADAAFDREPIAFNFGEKVYAIKKGKLLYKHKVAFALR